MSGEDENFSCDIHLYIYDMSKGLAKTLSTMFLGKCDRDGLVIFLLPVYLAPVTN